jgi:heme exporter protein CcmD
MTSADWPAWLTLGGLGAFVWGAYGLTLLALLADAWAARRTGRRGEAPRNFDDLDTETSP